MKQLFDNVYEKIDSNQLVEARLSYTTDEIEVNLFETKTKAYDFALKFNDLSLISMIKGKKVMHFERENFDFLPQEILVLDKYEKMLIDFPEADAENPTRCMALIISPDEISNTLDLLNENYQRSDKKQWTIETSHLKIENDPFLQNDIKKIISIVTSDRNHKSTLSKLATQGLIINLMQTKLRNLILKSAYADSNNQLFLAVDYIKKNIDKALSIDEVAAVAFMSRQSFFRHFKNELGITPNNFILTEKIKKAKQLLKKDFNRSVTDIAYTLAFSSTSHFIQNFKKIVGTTPYKYRQQPETLLTHSSNSVF